MLHTTKTAAENRLRLSALGRLSSRRRFWLFACVALAVFLQFGFWKLPTRGDRSNWDYFAQVIVRGGVPYRDVHNIKSPLSAYIGAAAIVALKPLGVRDVMAIRVMYVSLGALTVAFTYLVAQLYFRNRRIALLSGILMMAINQFAVLNSDGVQPKTPMVLFGLVTLWAIRRDRPFLAGVSAMVSALSWQPGLLFLGVAGLAFSRYLTSWRDLKVVRLMLGAAIPLAAMLGYFWAAGALHDFHHWGFRYNYSVYAPGELRTVPDFFYRIHRMLLGPYRGERLYFYISAIGFLLIVARQVRSLFRGGASRLPSLAARNAILIAPAVYFGFCMINIQGGADLIPILPFMSIFSAVGILFLFESGLRAGRGLRPQLDWRVIRRAGFAALCALIFCVSVLDGLFARERFPTLQQQDAEVAEIVSHLRPGDEIFVHGLTEILVLSGLPNASKYFFLDRGKDLYLDQMEPGGFNGWFERLREVKPRVVALSRLRPVVRKDDFLEWVERDYEMREGQVFTYYLLKEND